MNRRLDRVHGKYNGLEAAEIVRELMEIRELCAKCEASLEGIFGPL